MRLHRLLLPRFKNLVDFETKFDTSGSISVVVGRNGTGKSNLLEALTIIFRDLDLGKASSFAYELTYECRGRIVRLVAEPGSKRGLLIEIDGSRSSRAALHGSDTVDRLLPDFVFGYYSGPSNRLASHFIQHQDSFSRALREGQERPLRRLFYAQPMHSQFVLLAFFLEGGHGDFLREYLRLESLDSVMFVLQPPYWASRRPLVGGDGRFWNARGAVADLLSEIHALALAPLRFEREIVGEHGRKEKRELVHLFLPDLSTLLELSTSKYQGRPQELFKAFESILAADLLYEVRVRVRSRVADGSLVFRELSEGEQQLLMVLGLLRFTREDESLFLLDEPDTHLNPAWSLRYAEMLERNIGSSNRTSHLIMATHDPLVVAGLTREQVTLLERSELGAVTSRHPDLDPRGMGVAGLLTSEIYGLASDLDTETFEKLERHRYLAASENLTEPEATELARLTEELESLDFAFGTRDPILRQFERAMASIERAAKPVLDPAEFVAQADQARIALSEILAEGDETTGSS